MAPILPMALMVLLSETVTLVSVPLTWSTEIDIFVSPAKETVSPVFTSSVATPSVISKH